MKAHKILLLALILISCSDDNVKPESTLCKQTTQLYVDLEREIEIYRVAGDRQVLADMRKELQNLATLKNQVCN